MLDLKGVLVDFGDTLAYFDEGGARRYGEGLVSIVTKYGYVKSFDDLDSSLWNTYGNSTKGEIKDFFEFWELFLKDLGVPRKPALIDELEEFRNHNAAVMFKLYEGVSTVLTTLKKKYRMVLVSNCAIGLSDVMKALGLTDFFEATVLSYEIGVRKPDRRIYLEALNIIKLDPEECIFVADEISDLEGAKEVGLKTLLVRQGPHTTHEAKDPNFKPDFQCNHISEIIKLL